jgi:hypothetical protein
VLFHSDLRARASIKNVMVMVKAENLRDSPRLLSFLGKGRKAVFDSSVSLSLGFSGRRF